MIFEERRSLLFKDALRSGLKTYGILSIGLQEPLPTLAVTDTKSLRRIYSQSTIGLFAKALGVQPVVLDQLVLHFAYLRSARQ
jgi:hypothetical protein